MPVFARPYLSNITNQWFVRIVSLPGKSLLEIPSSFKYQFRHKSEFLLQENCLPTRRPVGSTDQAYSSCFYFRISWILMEQHCFYFFCPLWFLQGHRSLKHWLLQKLGMKNLDQKFKFFIKKRYFGVLIFWEPEFFDP